MRSPYRPHGLIWVCRTENPHVWKRPRNSQILRRMMRHPQLPIGKTTANGYDLHIRIMIADAISDLLKAAHYRKVPNGISVYDIAFQRKAGGNRCHVLLADADVHAPSWESARERIKHAVPKIRRQHHNTRIFARYPLELRDQMVSHDGSPPSSRMALS